MLKRTCFGSSGSVVFVLLCFAGVVWMGGLLFWAWNEVRHTVDGHPTPLCARVSSYPRAKTRSHWAGSRANTKKLKVQNLAPPGASPSANIECGGTM